MNQNRYIEPLCSYGFKKIFGAEENKEYLIDFLNAILEGNDSPIVELSYLKSLQQETNLISVANIVVHCTNSDGDCYLVELMNDQHNFFINRATDYISTFSEDKESSLEHDYCTYCDQHSIKTFYLIDIIDCSFRYGYNSHLSNEYFYEMKIDSIKETNAPIMDKLKFIHLSTFKFNKQAHELKDKLEQWTYLIKNLASLNNCPYPFQLKNIEVSDLSSNERALYFNSLDRYFELKSFL